jgi:hypothetical protein
MKTQEAGTMIIIWAHSRLKAVACATISRGTRARAGLIRLYALILGRASAFTLRRLVIHVPVLDQCFLSRTGAAKAAPHSLTMGHYWCAQAQLKLGRIGPHWDIHWR